MRIALVTMVTVLALWCVALGGATDYTGEITFEDGSSTTYTWLWADFAGDKLPYSRYLEDLGKGRGQLRGIELSNVSRLDFINLSSSDRNIIEEHALMRHIRKAKVTFRDGAVYDSLYVDASAEWKNDHEVGRLFDPGIVGITVNVKDAKTCPNCSRQYAEADWEFCPYDGSSLK